MVTHLMNYMSIIKNHVKFCVNILIKYMIYKNHIWADTFIYGLHQLIEIKGKEARTL